MNRQRNVLTKEMRKYIGANIREKRKIRLKKKF